MKILYTIGITGAVFLCSTNPYFGLRIISDSIKGNRKKSWRDFYLSLNYLKRRGYVRLLPTEGDKIKAIITTNGNKIVKLLDINNMKLSKQEKWDEKWRVVIFDVPNYKSRNRMAFSQKLKEIGFIYFQKSVWAYPFECKKEIMILRKFYEIEKNVTYVEVVNVEDEHEWRSRFNLLSKFS